MLFFFVGDVGGNGTQQYIHNPHFTETVSFLFIQRSLMGITSERRSRQMLTAGLARWTPVGC